VEAAADEWPLPNREYDGSRTVLGGPIDSASVERLGVAWRAEIPDQSEYGFGAFATNPLVLGGRVYVQDLTSDVHVYDLADGTLIWETPEWNQPQLGPNGVAVGYGHVYAILGEHEVVALSIDDGTEAWRVSLRTQNDSEGITIQPILFDGLLLLSTVPGSSPDDFYSGGVSGILYALDAATGETVWSFDTDESGDLWGNEEVNSGGGAWYPPTVEVNSGRTFWGIGNPAPYPGTEEFPAGSSRPGRNLYTDSLVALGPDGSLDWFRQVRQGDLFDLDFQLPAILTRLRIDGQQRQIAIGGGKNGEVIAFGREGGRILWRTQVGRHENEDVRDIPAEGITVFPGTFGGVETPMAYANGVVYVPYVDVSTTYSPSGILAVGLDEDAGGVAAIDARTGEILWDTPYDSMVLGATTVVNDLLLTSTYDGRIIFLDRETGEEVWSRLAPGGINGWPAVVGDTVIVPVGMSAPAQLLVLRLEATETLPSPAPAPSEPPASPGASPAASPSTAPGGSPVASPGGSPATSPAASPSGSPAASAPASGVPASPGPSGSVAPA
jgi:outer membrane protein assembly factor BamB